MAVYDPIIPTETDPDQPLKSSLAKRWSDNWIAGFEGADAAPRMWPRAITKPSAGDVLKIGRLLATEVSTGSSGGVTLARVTFMSYGQIRIKVTGRRLAATVHSLEFSRSRRGVVTSLFSVNLTGTETVHSLDTSIEPFDTLTVAVDNAGSSNVRIRGVEICTDGTDIWACEATGSTFVPIRIENTQPL